MKRKVWVPESWLSEKAGVSRQVLKKYRVKGEYRQGKAKGRPYLWSERGVRELWGRLGIKEAIPALNDFKGSSESRTASNEVGSEPIIWPSLNVGERTYILGGSRSAKTESQLDLKLVTVSRLVPNKRILFAQNGSNEVLQVIVPISEVWAIGDPLRVKPSEQHKGYYELVGKAPRWRGDRIYRHEFV